VSRLPLRIRLTLLFAGAMAVVLAAVGAFVYVRLGNSFTEQLDETLEARAAALAPLVRRGELAAVAPAGPADDESFVRVLGPRGEVLVGPRANDPNARTLSVPVGSRTLVVGASLEDRDEALDGLLAQLLVGGPIALLLSSFAGYLLAGAALRPVEAMRRRAAEISADTAGRRLPLPEARDEIFRLGETLNAMLARLEAGLARERRFVADASHELRTPLALLKAELELALRRPRSPEELELALRSAAEEAERLVRLAEDLLVLASAEEDGLRLRVESIDVRELLSAVARRFAVNGRAIEVVAVTETLVGDRLRLEQALGNLVDNALHHGAGTVRLEAGPGALRVSDEGPGFPVGFLAHAFERFSRADVARTRGAAGLGLAIVDAIARAHGGAASARNLDGGGAEVTISLPAHRALIREP
jgi:two-component system, OmpR family, sensor kinase